jgi:hypothetical protein
VLLACAAIAQATRHSLTAIATAVAAATDTADSPGKADAKAVAGESWQ